MATKILVCVVMIIAAASAVPLMRDDFGSSSDSYQCARKCSGKTFKFNYEKAKTYVYEYNAEARTSVAGTPNDETSMKIEALANIEVIDDCEFALRLQNVHVYHSAPYKQSMKPAERSQEFERALTENTLRFSFDNGVIRDICHPAQEKVWVLNFKRGLLSAFQNSMGSIKSSEREETVEEVDVTGQCDVKYQSKGLYDWSQWASTKVTKTKNLLSCRQHSGLRTFIPMVPYKIASEIQSLPIMDSSSECEQIVTRAEKTLKSSKCTEQHSFSPLSKYPSGATTKISQTLNLKTVKGGVETSKDYVDSRTSLLFQHISGADDVPNSRQAAEQKLKEICEETKTGIRSETPRHFTELVQIVKVLDSSDLRNLYRMIKSKKLCSQNEKSMKFLLDSLPIAGTSGAVDLMATVINGDDIMDVEKNAWLSSLSLIPEPSEDMLPSLMKLVNGKSADKALLPVTALLNTLCKTSVNCDRNYQFKKIVNKINSNIDSSCSSKDLSQVLVTLRAIGNVGYGKDFLKTLRTCLTSDYAPLEVKVVAADAYRRFQCQGDEETGPLFEVFESTDADSELRIMSFLSIMRCPSESILRKIAAQLDKEEDVQVGTFVYTHLENLKETSDPHKQDIAKAVRHLTLKKFDDSGLKTSRNFEVSTLVNRLNLGYVADGDLIWSDSAKVPRAMRLNLTVELFGNSVNLFEAGARVDGLDQFINKYFGMEGYLAETQVNPKDLEAFIYGRMFGNELFFKHIKGTEEFDKVKSYLNFDTLLENLSKKYNFAYTHSQQLMDHSLIIPTAIGLPVNLTINSSVTVDTNAKGKFDFSGILSRSKPIAASTDMSVSAGLEVSGSMMVDAQLYKQGVRLRNTLHTSVSVKSSVTIRERQIVNFEIESPKERQELFDARSQLFVIHDNIENEQTRDANSEKIHSCTGEKFSQVTGMEVCGDVEYPNGPESDGLPTLSPARVTVIMDKKDTQKSYKIFAKWVKNSKKLEAQFQMDTPGSQVDRHISADITIGYHKNPHVDFVLISPWKKLVLNGKAAKNKDMASLTGSLEVDRDIKYKLTSEVKMNSKAKTHQYIPFVEVENNGERITLLSGSVIYNEKKDIKSTLEVKDFDQTPYTLGGQLIYSPQEKRIELSAGLKEKKPYVFKIGSSFKKSGRKNNIKVDPELLIEYSNGNIISWKSNGEFQAKPLKVSADIALNSVGLKRPATLKVGVTQRRQSYPVSVKLATPVIVGTLKGKVNVRKDSYSGDMKLSYKAGSTSDKITWNGKMLDRSKNSYTQYNLNSNLKFKSMADYNTLTTLEVTHKTSKDKKVQKNSAELTIAYGRQATKADKKKVIQVVGTANADLKEVELKGDLKVKAPEKNVDMELEFNHHHDGKKVDSGLKLHFEPLLENDIKADVLLRNKGRSLYAITAVGNLEAGGQKYSVDSELNQKSQKRYDHSLTVSSGDADKHTLVTVYKKNQNSHHIVTSFDSTQIEKPYSIDLSSEIENPSNFHISAALTEDKQELYSVDASSKLEGKLAGKWRMELSHPLRKMKAQAGFNNVKNRISTDASVNWDVGSKEKPSPEVTMTGVFTQIFGDDSLVLKGNVKLNTPLENLEKLHTHWNLEKSVSDFKSSGRVSWGGIHKQISTVLTAKLPITMEKAKMSLETKTPFKNYKDFEFEVDHMLNTGVKTTLRGKLNKDETELTLNGRKDITDYSRNIVGDLTLKTPHKAARQIVLSLDHSDDTDGLQSSVKINKDGQEYSVDVLSDFKHSSKRSGQLNLSGPDRSAKTSFVHRFKNGKHEIEASIDSALSKKRRQYSVDVTGHYLDLNNLKLNVDVKSPLKSLRKGGVEIGLEYEDGILESKIILIQNRGKTGYDLKLKNTQSEKSVDVLLLLSPLYEKDVYLKTTVQCDNYPVTVSSQVSWSPSAVIDLTGSYKAEDIDDLDLNLKLTTPFEGLENINIVASNSLKRSIRVSHLNIDYDMRKMIDVEVRSQNDELRKLLRLKVKVPSFPFESLDTGVSVDSRKGHYVKADLELLVTRKDKYEGSAFFKLLENKNIRGNLDIKTPIEGFENIEGSLTTDYLEKRITNTLKLSKGNEKLIDLNVDIREKHSLMTYTIVTEGTLFKIVAKEYSNFLKEREMDDIVPNFLRYKGETAQKFTLKIETAEIYVKKQLTITVAPEFEQNGPKEAVLILGLTSFKWLNVMLEATLKSEGESIHGLFDVEFTENTIRYVSTLRFPKDGESFGLEFHLSTDNDQFKSNGRIRLFPLEGSYDLVINSIQRIEFTSVTKGWILKSKVTTIKYTHDGQDNRASCSLTVSDEKGIKGSIDLKGQTSPIHLYSLEVTSPYEDYKNLYISGNCDDSEFGSLIKFNGEKLFSLVGSHDEFKNPKLTLKTPFRQLQALSVEANGQLSDGSSKFSLQFNDNEKIDGNVALKYDSPSQLEITSALTLKIAGSENNLKLEIENSVIPRKTSRFLLSLDDLDKIVFNSYMEKDYNGNNNVVIDLNCEYRTNGDQTHGLAINLDGNIDKATGSIEFHGDSVKILDADFKIDILSDNKAILTIRQPKQMEYSFAQMNFQRGNELTLNWDRTDPDANLVIGATYKDDSNKNKLDKSISLRLSFPSRSIGVEHAIVATATKVESSGRIFWNSDGDSQVAYDLTLADKSNRRKNAYDGQLKLKLPTRTVGFDASLRDMSRELQAETTLSWDMDQDNSKKVGLKGTYLKSPHTQADISLILPKDAHVDSKLVVNKGNTILEGQTQIFFSRDTSKTLTLFSKLENNPQTSGFFSSSKPKTNYSIQLGMSHPDSRIDMKMMSHLGYDSERWTSSIGLDYLTSRRQEKNSGLFMEIDKIKKEINLITVTPYKTVGISGAVVSQDPVEYKASMTVDDEERYALKVKVDPQQKEADLDWTSYGTKFSYSAFFPDKNALRVQRNQENAYSQENDYALLFKLPSPSVFQATLNWRRGLIEEARDRAFDNFRQFWREMKDLSEDLGDSIKREVEEKYEAISSSIFDDVKSFVDSMEQEIISFEEDLALMDRKLPESFDTVSIDKYIPVGTYLKGYSNLRPVLAELRKVLQSVSRGIVEMKNIPTEEVVENVLKAIQEFESALFDTEFYRLFESLYRVSNDEFEKDWDKAEKFIKALDPQELIDDLNERVETLKNTKLSDFVAYIIEEHDLGSKLKDLLVDQGIDDDLEEVLLDSKIYKTLLEWGLVELTKDIVDSEASEVLNSLPPFRNPITRFDPQVGVLQVEVPLFISLDGLAPTVPDVRSI